MKSITAGYMTRISVDAIIYAMEHSSAARRDVPARKEKIRFDPFLIFASNVIHRSEVKIPTILVALVYIERAEEHLFIQSPEWACERVFLGALILANKVGIRSHVPCRGTNGGLIAEIRSMSTTARSRTTSGHYVLACLVGAT